MGSFRERFKKAGEAKVYGSGAYVLPGDGILCIKAQKHNPNANGGEVFVMEYQVVAAVSNGAKNAAGKIEPNVPGSMVSEALKIGASDQKMRSVAESKLMERQLSIYGLTAPPEDREIYADMLEEGSSDTGGTTRIGNEKFEPQPTCGVLLAFEATHIDRSAEGKEPLTKVKTSHIPNQTEEGIALRRAKMLAGDTVTVADCADVKIPNRFM